MRRTKLSELSSGKNRHLAQLSSSELVWIVQHVKLVNKKKMYDNVYLTPFGRKLIIDLIQLIGSTRRSIREFKLHVYGKGQTSDSSWEFLKMENERIKTAHKFLMDKKSA